jgi:hypothetical protein
LKAFLVKAWGATKWVWERVLSVASFVADFIKWCKERRKAE